MSNLERKGDITLVKVLSNVQGFLNKDSKRPIELLVLLLSGVITGLTVAFPVIGFLEWIAIIPAAVILLRRGSDKKIKLRSLYVDGLAFFYGYYLVCWHFFLSMYPLDFIDGVTKGTAAAVVAISWFGLALLQALFGGFVFLLSGVIFRGRICEKLGILKPVVAAALWTTFEWSQNFGWWGVPWGKLPLGQTKYLIGIQNASWLGSYFLTFALVFVNCVIAYGLLHATMTKMLRLCSIFAISVIAFQYLTGLIIWHTTDISEGESVKVACAQGNISASNKWTVDTLRQLERVYWEQTREAAEQGAKIVLWPETAIPFDITANLYSKYDNMCKALAKETEVYILVGAYTNDGEKSYNSLVCYTPEGERFETIYNKRRLVPFGEFIPLRAVFEKVLPPLTEILITFDDIYEGESSSIMNMNGTDVGCLICFDSIYDGLTLNTVRDGAEIICLSTNDSWFSGSQALSIHNSHAQLRAIESGRYITRCASTGISTIISPRGEVLSQVEADTEGLLVYDVYKRDNHTVRNYIGNAFVYICLAFLGLLVLEMTVYKIREKKNQKI